MNPLPFPSPFVRTSCSLRLFSVSRFYLKEEQKFSAAARAGPVLADTIGPMAQEAQPPALGPAYDHTQTLTNLSRQSGPPKEYVWLNCNWGFVFFSGTWNFYIHRTLVSHLLKTFGGVLLLLFFLREMFCQRNALLMMSRKIILLNFTPFPLVQN